MKPNNALFTLLLLLSFGFDNNLIAQTQITFNLLWEQNLFPNNPYSIQFDKLNRPYFYVANDNGGVRIFKNETNTDPLQVGQVTIDNWDGLKVMGLAQQDAYLYLALGSFFDSGQQEFGIAIINVENPEAPLVTDYWVSTEQGKGSAVVRVVGDYAFLGAMNGGLYIFDIRNPSLITEMSNYLPNPDFPITNPNVTQEPNARGMVIKDSLLFLCYDAGGISVIDISDLFAPIELHRYINSDFVNITQQAYNNMVIDGDLAYVATDFCGLEILDISNPLDISQVGIWNPWACETLNNTWFNSLGHANQLGFLPGHEGTVLIMNANDTELVALDVSDATNPQLIGSFGETGDNIRTWGLGIGESQIAAAYYFTLLPWLSSEAKVKLFDWNLIVRTKEVHAYRPKLYPNPVSRTLTIDFGQAISGEFHVRIFNLLGTEVFDQRRVILNRVLNFDLSELNLAGLFAVQIELGDQIISEKIIISTLTP